MVYVMKIAYKFILMTGSILILAAFVYYCQSHQTETVNTNASTRELPIYCVNTDKKQIALTFDAAWGDTETEHILDILAQNNVKVTFFVTGGWVDQYPDTVKKILDAGHDLGNHTQNHKNMTQLSSEQIQDELQQVSNKVKELTNYDMFLFRAPYGEYNNTLITTARSLGYYSIQWDVDSLDWKDYSADNIVNTVCNHSHLGNGSIILCHNAGKYTADALDTLIKNLKTKGYELVPISSILIQDDYYMNVDGRQLKK